MVSDFFFIWSAVFDRFGPQHSKHCADIIERAERSAKNLHWSFQFGHQWGAGQSTATGYACTA
jgi:hypothetical protein